MLPFSLRLAALMLAMMLGGFPAAAAEEAVAPWSREGLWLTRSPPPPPIVDDRRIAVQRSIGCGVTPVRFGDTAFLRGFRLTESWPPDATRRLAAAEVTDDADDALAHLRAAGRVQQLTNHQRAAVDLQTALVALKFARPQAALATLSGISLADMPEPMLADLLLLQTLAEAPGATAEAWDGPLDARLAAAATADPSSFAVRFWRLVAWFKAGRSDARAGSCAGALRDLQDRVLSLSEASPCPLMLAHADHALRRELGAEPQSGADGPQRAWHAMVVALLAEVAEHRPVADAMTAAIARQSSPGPCRGIMLKELERLRAAP